MRKKYVLLLICFLLSLQKEMFAQEIKPGATMPFESFSNVYNWKSTRLSLQEFAGKTVIFDFWGTGCVSCLHSFPKIDSLQKRYGDRLQFILVCHEGAGKLDSFFALRKKVKLPAVPVITAATWLFNALPQSMLSASVWIDPARVVQFITMEYNTTTQHLDSFLNGKAVKMADIAQKKSVYGEPLLVNENGSAAYYSAIGHCRNEVNHGNTIETDSMHMRLTRNCQSLFSLCKEAFEEGGKHAFRVPASVDLQTEDSGRFIRPDDPNKWDQWEADYSYNYELVLPSRKAGIKYRIMQSDLEKYFGLDVRIEKRSVKALVLVRTSSKDLLRTKGGEAAYQLYETSIYHPEGGSTRFLRNAPFSLFARIVKGWSEGHFQLPFFDETGYKGNIDISFSGQLIDHLEPGALQKELSKYGLRLIEEERPIEVLVIREKKE